MSVLSTVLGFGVLAVTVVDVFLTILGGHSAGSVTKCWSALVWRAMLAAHERRPAHHALNLAGPFIVVLTVVLWYLGLILGAWLILAAHPGSVVSNSTRAPADLIQVFYFVPGTVSGLGYGDLVPSRWPWTALATTVSLAGAIVLTSSLSYIISVVGAAIRRRTYALSVHGLGEAPTTIIPRLRLEDPRESMRDYMTTITSSLTEVAEQQLTYPVLRYFHTVRQEASPAVATLVLADTAYLLAHLPPALRPGPGLSALLESAITGFADAKHVRHTSSRDTRERTDTMIQHAQSLGLDTSDGSSFTTELDEYLERRDHLVAACRDDGWAVALDE